MFENFVGSLIKFNSNSLLKNNIFSRKKKGFTAKRPSQAAYINSRLPFPASFKVI